MARHKKQKHKQQCPAPGDVQARTLFVCVRNRHGHGRSCAGSGSLALVNEARSLLQRERIGPEELAVRPVGCLGLCERGPVCVAVAGEAAQNSKPPLKKKRRGAAALVTLEVEPRELRPILREALLQKV